MLSRTILFIIAATSLVVMVLYAAVTQAQSRLVLTQQEQDFLQQRDVIRVCTDPDWLPYEGINQNGQYVGIMSDFHQYWSDLIGKPIQLQPSANWHHSLKLIKQKQCDVLSSAQDIPNRRAYLAFTEPFIYYPFAVATQPDNNFIINLRQVMDKRFVMVKGYAGVDIVRETYPQIKLSVVSNAEEGLKKVETGRAFGYIDTVPSINYQTLKHGISHIKINGVLEQQYAMSVGIRQDLPVLLSIYNKAITATTEESRQRILNNWLSIRFQQEFDKTLLWQILGGIAAVIALLLYRYLMLNQHNRELRQLNKQLEHLSRRDHLTGLPNRYFLHQTFQAELSRFKRYQQGFAIVMLDIDNFKRINDSFGHVVGDQVIQSTAKLLSDNIREQDMVARWGGEEFLILCPATDLTGARALAEHLREQIRRNQFTLDNIEVTASFGVTDYRDDEDIEVTTQRADEALYQAKHSGRDKTVIF